MSDSGIETVNMTARDGVEKDQIEEHPGRFFTGLRLLIAIAGMGIAIFLPTAEASIISTSLVTISKDLGDYEQSSWVVTAYLVTYTGFIFIWSKLADTVGYRTTILVSGVIFIAFSAACGAADSIMNLAIFRAFQGIGGAGMYSVPTVGMVWLVPEHRLPMINTTAACLMAISLLIAPLIGGAISETSNWRWIFYFNVPASAVSLGMILFILPPRFPNHYKPRVRNRETFLESSIYIFHKADTIGSFLIVAATALLVTALQEGGVHFEWNSSAIICFFIFSGILWILFVWWEVFSSRETSQVDPIFPRRLFSNRFLIGNLLALFVVGIPLIVAVIQIPQRFQIVNGVSPLTAGVQLLAYAATMPVSIMVSNVLVSKVGIPVIYTWLGGTVLEIIGFSLLSTLPTTPETWGGQYGYLVITGVGLGYSVGTYYFLAPMVVDEKDRHLSIGAGLQIRMLGSAVGLAIVASIFNDYLRRNLAPLLPPEALYAVLQSADSIAALPMGLQDEVKAVYGEAFNLQMRATIGFSAVKILLVAFIWKWPPIRMTKEGKLV